METKFENLLKLAFICEEDYGPDVPLHVVASKLQALQHIVYHAIANV